MVKTIYAALLLPFLLWGCGNDSGLPSMTTDQREALSEMERRCEEATGSKCEGSLGGISEVSVYSRTSNYSCIYSKRDGIRCGS